MIPPIRRPHAGHGVPNEAAFGVSQLIVAGGLAHVAGQIARTPEGRPLASGSFAGHVRHALANLEELLGRVGLGLDDVVWAESHVVGEPEELAALHPELLDPASTAGVLVPIEGLYDPAYRVELTTIAVTEELRMHRQSLPGPPGSPFARAVRAGPHVFVSGQHGLVDDADPAECAEQFATALDRVLACVAELGGGADDVVSTHIYTARELAPQELAQVAEVHRQRFSSTANRPTTNLIGVRRLTRPQALVEVTGVAVIDTEDHP